MFNVVRSCPIGPIRLLTLLGLLSTNAAADRMVVSARDAIHPVFAEHGMVSTQEATATRVGVEILRRGGNAIDAAVAVGFTLAVTLPRAGNLGGGGFMLVHTAATGNTVAIDYREKAPAAAHRDLFLDPDGSVNRRRARFSHHSAGVPGTVAGLAMALERHGTMSLRDIIEPAIALARDGIVVTRDLADSLASRKKRLARSAATARIFLKPDGNLYRAGERLVQSDLAATLERIAEHGASAFYTGGIAQKLAADMSAHGGLIAAADLAAYQAVERRPVHGTYRGHDVYSMPPPSSGGIHLIQILNILEDFPIAFLGFGAADTIHIMVEAMKLAYADRSEHLGDPDFWTVPGAGLTSKAYAAQLRRRIHVNRARPSRLIKPGDPSPYESSETTHYSVMDEDGNVVSNTYTINFGYGSGLVATGTGVLWNNEMDDFSAKPGIPNAYGLLGGQANAIAGGKRPLSSMTPTIVLKNGKPFLATGSPGGSRIITTTVQILLNVIDHGMNVATATLAPRIHHQWLPDELRVEQGLSPDTVHLLAERGHRVVMKNAMGATQSIMRTDKGFLGASDPRRRGALTLGY